MASPVYVWDGSSQDDADATWNSSTIAYLTLDLALAAVDAFGRIYTASKHTQTQAGDLILNSTNGNVTIISVDKDDGDVYQTMRDNGTPGKIEISAGDFSFPATCSDIYEGVTLIGTVGSDDMIISGIAPVFRDCKLGFKDDLILGSGGGKSTIEILDCEVVKTGTGIITLFGGIINWIGGSFGFEGGAVAVYLLIPSAAGNSSSSNFHMADVDIQDLDAGDSLLKGDVPSGHKIEIKRCKVPVAFGGLISGTIPLGGIQAKFHSVSSSDIIYQLQENDPMGQVNEDTAIYLDAGYDGPYDGTNGYSVKMVSTVNVIEWTRPLRFKLAEIWNPTANADVTVELVLDSVVPLNNDDFAIFIEAPDSTIGALGRTISSKMTNITDTPAVLTSSAVVWTGTGGFTNEQKRKVTLTLTDDQVGVLTVWAELYKPSTTIFANPKVVLS